MVFITVSGSVFVDLDSSFFMGFSSVINSVFDFNEVWIELFFLYVVV